MCVHSYWLPNSHTDYNTTNGNSVVMLWACTVYQEIFAGPNFHENPVSPPEEIFAVLIFAFSQHGLLTMPLSDASCSHASVEVTLETCVKYG